MRCGTPHVFPVGFDNGTYCFVIPIHVFGLICVVFSFWGMATLQFLAFVIDVNTMLDFGHLQILFGEL